MADNDLPDPSPISIEEVKGLIESFNKHIGEFDALATTVLKAHFLVEKRLVQLLQSLARCPDYLELGRTTGFDRKVKLLRAFAPLGNDGRWQIVAALNTVRNNVAHKADGPERKQALQKLRETWKPFLRGNPDASDEWADYNILVAATLECFAFFSTIEAQIKATVQ
jgi:hypothetical protein